MRNFGELKAILGNRLHRHSTNDSNTLVGVGSNTSDKGAVEVGVESTGPASPTELPGGAHPKTGQLDLEEDAKGGLGRHLGVFSTTFLM